MTLKQVAERWGLTKKGVDHALEQYQKIIFDLTNGKLSKLTYDAGYVLSVIHDEWCDNCDLKEEYERTEAERNLLG